MLEPLPGVAPKFPELTRNHRFTRIGESTVLTGEAQGNPPPNFRLSNL